MSGKRRKVNAGDAGFRLGTGVFALALVLIVLAIGFELYLSALVEIGLVLFIVTLVVNGLSRLLIWSMSQPAKKVATRPAGGVAAA